MVDTRNRAQSGCQAANGRSVCNSAPFSQAFHDPQNNVPGDQSINCDEWPMATTKQSDFAPPAVVDRSSEHSSKVTPLLGVNPRRAPARCKTATTGR
ncbi:MAG: hypothetical protein Q9180_006609 [Flavoplaca navasiana]